MCVCVLFYTSLAQATWLTEIVAMNLSGDVGGHIVEIQYPFPPSPGQPSFTDLGGGNWQIDSFFDVFTEISVDGGPFLTGPTGSVDTRVRRLPPPPGEQTAIIETEILSMSLVGLFPTPIAGQEVIIKIGSPTENSPGTVDPPLLLPDGNWQIDSFFDVFTEISIDGGPWLPGPSGIMHTNLIMPEPSIALVGIGLLVLIKRKK